VDDEHLQPSRLPEKLRQIRKVLGITPANLLKRLGVEGLVDDELDLPEKLPGNKRHEGIKHNS